MSRFIEVPRSAMQFNVSSGDIELAKDVGSDSTRFIMHGYTGKAMSIPGVGDFIVDIKGVDLGKRQTILREHDPARIVGYTTKLSRERNGVPGVWAEGVFTQSTHHGREVAATAADGVPWQCSISITDIKAVELAEDEELEVNGEMRKGPALIAKKSKLREISFTVSGMDGDTTGGIAASETDEKVQIEIINLSQSQKEEAEMSDEKNASTEVEKDSAEVAADTPVEDVAVEAEEVVVEAVEIETEEVEEEVKADEAVAVEPVEDAPEPDKRKELAAELTAMVEEFGSDFALQCFTDGLTMDQAKLANYDNLKAQAAGKVAELADGVPALTLGVKTEGPKTLDEAALEIQRKSCDLGEAMKLSVAMELAVKRFPTLKFEDK